VDFLIKRLGYTRAAYTFLFSCKAEQLQDSFSQIQWKKIIKKDFAIKAEKKSMSLEKKLAKMIFRQLKAPKVNLDNPDTEINIFQRKGCFYCAVLYKTVKSDFNKRKPHNRPELHPSSLDPRFARVMINLTGIKTGKLYDLFCGSGGILLEAALMGLKPIGIDIDRIMINRARINLVYFGIDSFTLYEKDSLSFNKRIGYLVSDLPYGKNTKGKDFQVLYLDFLDHLKKILLKRATIILPEFKTRKTDYKKILKDKGFDVLHSYSKFIHNSLSRKIFVIEKNKK
jgi:tRNA (guanine10-N2)-dimethyltransferase